VSLFSSGYAVNTGTLSALVRKNNHVVMDRAAHMSILEGAQLSRARLSYFRHNDVAHLREILASLAGGGQRIVVCTEGLFSADGDFGALRDIARTAHEFGARVLVDEAHSFLVAGPTGRGVAEEQGVLAEVDLLVLTFSKAFGGIGGALVAPREITRYVNWYARCRMFSCAMDPAVTAGVAKALEIAAGPEGDARRVRVRANAARLGARLRGKVNLGTSESWIVTVIYGEEERTLPLLDFLQTEGLDASVLQFPAVPVNESRLRLFLTSEHTPQQIDRAAHVVIRAAERFGFTL
jgi:glycine C-acetyltransferase